MTLFYKHNKTHHVITKYDSRKHEQVQTDLKHTVISLQLYKFTYYTYIH